MTGALLFVVLFYVYPMKFVWTLFINGLLSDEGSPPMSEMQFTLLLTIYSGGFAAVFAILAALYVHALRHRVPLELTPVEVHLAREEIQDASINVAVGLLSVALAWVTHNWLFATAPYWFIGVFQGINGGVMRRKRAGPLADVNAH